MRLIGFGVLAVLCALLGVGVAHAQGHRGGQHADFSNVVWGVTSGFSPSFEAPTSPVEKMNTPANLTRSAGSAPAFHVEPPITTVLHHVPERCRAFQRQLVAEAHTVFGLDAPIAPLAAQIEAESACRPDAHSSVGACGLTQFMPGTASDMAERYVDLQPTDCTNPRWAIKAQVRYMHELTTRLARTDCDRWAFGFSAYNGGDGWVRRDQRLCTAPDCDALQWFGHVDARSSRSSAAILENRTYVRRILLDYQPGYASWGPVVACAP